MHEQEPSLLDPTAPANEIFCSRATPSLATVSRSLLRLALTALSECNPAPSDGLTGDEQQDYRSLALTEIDWNRVLFPTCLKGDETSITGEEKLKHLQASGEILLDAKVGEELLLDYKTNGENSVLEKLRQQHNVTYLDFFGTILRNPRGNRCVLYLCFSGGQWRWFYGWLGDVWFVFLGSAALASPPAV